MSLLLLRKHTTIVVRVSGFAIVTTFYPATLLDPLRALVEYSKLARCDNLSVFLCALLRATKGMRRQPVVTTRHDVSPSTAWEDAPPYGCCSRHLQ